MEKRAMLTFVLIMLLWVGYYYFFLMPQQQELQRRQQTTAEEQTGLRSPTAIPFAETDVEGMVEYIPPEEEASTGEKEAAAEGAEESFTEAALSGYAAEERIIRVETKYYKAEISNLGGTIRSWCLKEYGNGYTGEECFEMLPEDESLTGGYPLLVTFDSGELQESFEERLYRFDSERDIILDERNPEEQIELTVRDSRGRRFIKTLVFHYDSYLVDISTTLENGDDEPVGGRYTLNIGGPLRAEGEEEAATRRRSFSGPMAYQNEELQKIKVSKLDLPTPYTGDIPWAAVSDAYFCSALIPENPSRKMIKVYPGVDKENYRIGYVLGAPELPGRRKTTGKLSLYMGPKDLDRLKEIGHQLHRIVDFGFFGFLARPLLDILKFTYRFTGNYGVSIIILTILIKVLFFPLSRKQMQSMSKMQQLQPEINRLREKYKSDPKRLNEETMRMYKEHNVNPLGGCLPVLVQIPVFFALYQVLLNSIELRHAPFFFWIHDLSARDPYYITPIMMGASMFIQQHMTPTTGASSQTQFLKFMPLIFTFLFLNFPTGLVIYWLSNNLLTIGQQVITMKIQKKTPDKAAKRGNSKLIRRRE